MRTLHLCIPLVAEQLSSRLAICSPNSIKCNLSNQFQTGPSTSGFPFNPNGMAFSWSGIVKNALFAATAPSTFTCFINLK